jgi:hypothetical protein
MKIYELRMFQPDTTGIYPFDQPEVDSWILMQYTAHFPGAFKYASTDMIEVVLFKSVKQLFAYVEENKIHLGISLHMFYRIKKKIGEVYRFNRLRVFIHNLT